MGVEPTLTAPQAGVLPVHYNRHILNELLRYKKVIKCLLRLEKMGKPALISLTIIVLVIVVAFGMYYWYNQGAMLACTEEAKLCDDGNSVARNASNDCRFDACPEPSADELSVICTFQGGMWGVDFCSNSCDYKRAVLRGEETGCNAMFVEGCSCGKNMCWNGRTCERL